MTPKQTAILGGRKTYNTGKLCIQGHLADRRVENSQCVECARLKCVAYRAQNPSKASVDSKRWRKGNPDATAVRNAEYYAMNREGEKARASAYRAANPDKVKAWELTRNRETKLQSNRAWRQANPDKTQEYSRRQYQNNPGPFKASAAKRRTRMTQASLPLSEDNQIKLKAIYANCPEGYHVDHVVPLNHPKVSGLHVPWNLQYLSANNNLAKGNKLPSPDQLIARIAA